MPPWGKHAPATDAQAWLLGKIDQALRDSYQGRDLIAGLKNLESALLLLSRHLVNRSRSTFLAIRNSRRKGMLGDAIFNAVYEQFLIYFRLECLYCDPESGQKNQG